MAERDTLLLACGSAERRAILRTVYEENYNILEAERGEQAMLLLRQNHPCIAMVLLDISDPEKGAVEILSEAADLCSAHDIALVVGSESYDLEKCSWAMEQGAVAAFPYLTDMDLMEMKIDSVLAVFREKWKLAERVSEQEQQLLMSNDVMVDVLSSLIEYRSVETGQHTMRIRKFTNMLLQEVARNCPEYELTAESIRKISSAASLHDIGKIAVPDAILNKPGPLTPEEWTVMRKHSETGAQVVEMLRDITDKEYLRYAHNICHYHHERWDGRGYPDGLAGDEIPICAQVVGLADAYDAMTTRRVYKDAYSHARALNEILSGACGAFSPKLLECLKHVSASLGKLAEEYADGRSAKVDAEEFKLPTPNKQAGKDALEVSHMKYQSLLHYIDGAVAEVDLDEESYHLVYNSDPNLAALNTTGTFREILRSIVSKLVMPEDRKAALRLFHRDIAAMTEDGTRRRNLQVNVRSSMTGRGVPYDVTLLRVGLDELLHRRFIFICRRADAARDELLVPRGGESGSTAVQAAELAGIYRFQNDNWYTIESASGIYRLIGYTDEEVKERFQNRLIELIEPEDRRAVRESMEQQLVAGTMAAVHCRMRHKDGRVCTILIRSRLVVDAAGNEQIYAVLVDITDSQQDREEMRLALERYEIILNQTENIIFEWDILRDEATYSHRWREILGYEPIRSNLLQQIPRMSHFHPEDIQKIMAWLRGLKDGEKYLTTEVRLATSEGRYLWVRFRASTIADADGKPIRAVGLIQNIDAEKRSVQELQDKSERDALTGLLNKDTAQRYAAEYLDSCEGEPCCALMVIDLDNFKQVNDRYGHMFGDAVLSQAAAVIKNLFRAQDVVGRIGGDEFMVMMRGVTERRLVENRCARLIGSLRSLFSDQMERAPLSCTVGVAMAPEHGTTWQDLFRCADQALYLAKDKGKDTYLFYDDQNPIFHTPRKLGSSITAAIDSDEQPELTGEGIVQYAFSKMYSARNLEQAIQDVLTTVGKQVNVDRVYVFEDSADGRYCSNTFEWCNHGIEPQIEQLQNISYEEDIPGYRQAYDNSGVFYCSNIESLNTELRAILEPQGINSIVHCAIMDGGVFRGYIGFDECTEYRLWTDDQIEILRRISEMLAVFLLKKRAQDKLEQHVADLAHALDAQKSWIYVIDPDTCELKFINARTRELAPAVEVGMRCYQALTGRDDRCPGCPAANVGIGCSVEAVIENQYMGLKVEAEASHIRWKDEDCCLLTCREIK